MMALHPEVVKRAQDEIDAVTNVDRLPTLDDRFQLPFIDCIVKETYRYVVIIFGYTSTYETIRRINPAGPLGMAKIVTH